MTNQQIKKVILKYDLCLAQMGIEVGSGKVNTDDPLSHVRWMCGQIMALLQESFLCVDEMQALDLKINRWLGFIQGVLYTKGVYSIDEMREHNKR